MSALHTYTRIHAVDLSTDDCRLAAVNFFLGCVGVVQVTRIFLYRRSLKGSTKEAAADIANETKESASIVKSSS